MIKNFTLTILLFTVTIITSFAQELSEDFLLKNRYLNTNSYADLPQHLAGIPSLSLVQKNRQLNLKQFNSFSNLRLENKKRIKFKCKNALVGLGIGALAGTIFGAVVGGGNEDLTRLWFATFYGITVGGAGATIGFGIDLVDFWVRSFKKRKKKSLNNYLP